MSKYKINVLKAANEDLQEAIEYYEEQKSGLGFEFFVEYGKTEDRISQNPYQYEKQDENFHKANLHRFPYSTYYEVVESQKEVTVNAVIHQNRDKNIILEKLRKK